MALEQVYLNCLVHTVYCYSVEPHEDESQHTDYCMSSLMLA